MPVCAQAVQQADGSLALVLDQTTTDVSTCAYVVQTGPEIASSLVAFSADDGAQVSAIIVSVWAAAWGVRVLIDVVRGSSDNE